MSKSIVVEDWTLEDCRRRAAEHLGVPADELAVRVLRTGRRGFFSSSPYRVSASVRGNGGAGGNGSRFLAKLDAHVKIAMAEMERIDVLKEGNEGQMFDEVLASYEQLGDERREEVLALSELLSGPTAQKIQEKVAKDGRFTLRVSDDRLAAFISVWPPEGIGQPVKMRDVLERMRGEGVSHGVDGVKLRKMLDEVVRLGRPIQDVQVAAGQPAGPGRDGAVDCLVAPSNRESVMRADGSVDHRGKVRVTAVKQGQLLARLVPPTPGEPGMTVCGEELAAEPGKAAELAAGENVTFDPDTLEYRSEIDGILEASEGAIYVRRTFVVPGDVDMTTGNIEFNGTVQVMGSVRDGFSVRAREDIEIHGGVEGCEVVSETGSVRVRQGVAGRQRCFISAGRDVEAKYVENARVYARNDVKVEVAIMHSEVVAGNSVLATSGKGAIIGGTTKAGREVQALVLGAANEPVTNLLVGIGIEDQDRLRDLDQRTVALGNAAMRLEEVVKEFEHATKNVEALPPGDKEQYVGLRKKLVVLHYAVDKAEEQRREFVKEVSAEARGTVRATREVFGRVLVRIGQFQDHVERLLPGACFRADLEQGRVVRER